MFGSGSIYANFNWFWLIGASLPLIFWVMTRKFGLGFARHLNAPIMLGAMAWLPPATPLSFWSWAIFGLLFNYYIKKRFNGWWSTYNYITAAGLDAGLILSTIVIFFAITLPDVTIPQWWGNVDVFNTLVSPVVCWSYAKEAILTGLQDANYAAVLKTVPEGETFGPKTW